MPVLLLLIINYCLLGSRASCLISLFLLILYWNGAFLETLEMVLNIGLSNIGDQGKMGFLESSWGVVGGIVKNLVFG